MDINQLVKITSKAWALEILSLLHEGIPGRQAPLLKASGAGRTAFAQSLKHLEQLNLIERNPGHGHPLRPEFRFTQAGRIVARTANDILKASPEVSANGLIRKAWTLPILAVSGRPMYFSEIKQELGSITDRALSQSLLHLQKQDWIDRQFDLESRPPRPLYQANNTGAEISRIIGFR